MRIFVPISLGPIGDETGLDSVEFSALDSSHHARDEVVGALLAFCQGSVPVVHNLPFEERFLAHELARLGLRVPPLPGVCGQLLAYLLNDARRLGLTSRPRYSALPRVAGPPRLKPRASGLRKGTRGWMACLMERLPVSTVGVADPVMAAAYLDLLTAALADGKITGPEARALAELASRAGMSRAEVEGLHLATFQGMYQVADEDGVITTAEAAARACRQGARSAGPLRRPPRRAVSRAGVSRPGVVLPYGSRTVG